MDESRLSEQDMTTDLLYDEKQMLDLYGAFLQETDSQNLRAEAARIYTESQQVQFELLNTMRTRGWQTGRNARLTDVAQALTQAMACPQY